MHCTSCALNIEWELEDVGAKAKCNYTTEVLEIEADFSKLSEEKIQKVIHDLGYSIVKTE